MTTLTLRPIEAWPWKETAHRGTSRFRSSWAAIDSLLRSEADKINASTVVLQIDVMERDIRLDGWIKATARPSSPRVVITIERWRADTLAFHCDSYLDWQDNVYAIAKTLEALRAIDRYGVSSSGEQYTGWKAIGDGRMTKDEAARLLAEVAGVPDRRPLDIERSAPLLRAARVAAHPDTGGSHERFVKVEEAGRVLGII